MSLSLKTSFVTLIKLNLTHFSIQQILSAQRSNNLEFGFLQCTREGEAVCSRHTKFEESYSSSTKEARHLALRGRLCSLWKRQKNSFLGPDLWGPPTSSSALSKKDVQVVNRWKDYFEDHDEKNDFSCPYFGFGLCQIWVHMEWTRMGLERRQKRKNLADFIDPEGFCGLLRIKILWELKRGLLTSIFDVKPS